MVNNIAKHGPSTQMQRFTRHDSLLETRSEALKLNSDTNQMTVIAQRKVSFDIPVKLALSIGTIAVKKH